MSVADLSGSRLTDAPVSAHARRGGLKAGEGRFGVLLLVPALCAFGLVVMWPFLQALAYSFFEYTLYTPEPVWVGIANFQKVLSDPGFWESLTVTAIYVVLTTFFSIVLGFAWALILNEPFRGVTSCAPFPCFRGSCLPS